MKLLDIKGIANITEKKLNKLGIYSPEDLIDFLPKGYLDLNNFSDESAFNQGNFVFFKLLIDNVEKLRRFNGVNFFRARGKIFSYNVYLVWFNQPYMQKNVEENTEYFVYGKLKAGKGGFEIISPHFERADASKRLKGVIPVYPTKGLIAQKTISNYIKEALKNANPTGIAFPNIKDIYQNVHFPKDYGAAKDAQRKLFIEDAVKHILAYKIFRLRDKRDFYYKDFNIEPILKKLPFALTESQNVAVNEIIEDLNKPLRMNRILSGDTGSGKTAVSLVAAYLAINSGGQVALMAPTEILAQQHYNFFNEILNGQGFITEYLSGSTPASQKKEIYKKTASGEISVLIGTEAVFNKNLQFKRLALSICDEQQRFGVSQKSALELKGFQTDSLVLSATPIPRAMSLIGYGELALSKIERRFEQKNITTGIVTEEKTEAMLSFIKEEIIKGKQAFFVCPKIEDEEGIDLDSAKNLYENLKSGLFKEINIALLHGKMKSEEKNAAIEGLRNKSISALVSTTVIEVGIDIPAVSIIAIMNADRFGLSALHQLRGRVGRNGLQAYCFLQTDKECERLKILKDTTDGFLLAEKDFSLRGGGDYLGLRQSGKEGICDYNLLIEAKNIADSINILSEDQKKMLYDYYNFIQKVSLN